MATVCLKHPKSPANVLCRKDQALFCAQCYIDGDHRECGDVIDVNAIKSRNGQLAVEMIIMQQEARRKLQLRETFEEEVKAEQMKVEEKMNEYLNSLYSKLDEFKANSEVEAKREFGKHLRKVQREKRDVQSLLEELDTAVDEALAVGPNQPPGLAEGVKRRAVKELLHVDDGQLEASGRLMLADHLHHILQDKVPAFGTYHLHTQLTKM
ncbi:uncharacterized protein LOC128227029 [Mya arenaria]|uniref:uncharacterized protein LOC128227029 n=1 Tax=Mya arenaria TaxID=6604 RepID=UPI0022E12382|nr:uncharacterized protein LOC128227029 [Mya arenaria]